MFKVIELCKPILPIATLMADSEFGALISYSSFIITTELFHFVSGVFPSDGRTDGRKERQTTRTITIAGPHIVAVQLINVPSTDG